MKTIRTIKKTNKMGTVGIMVLCSIIMSLLHMHWVQPIYMYIFLALCKVNEVKVSLHWHPQLLGNLWSHTLADTVCHRQRSVWNTSLLCVSYFLMKDRVNWNIVPLYVSHESLLIFKNTKILLSNMQMKGFPCKTNSNTICTCSCWHSVCF